jgi:transcriptional regulator with XRE-family HTH domain
LEALLHYRERHGLSNVDLAGQLGIDDTTLSRFFSGKQQGIGVDIFVRAVLQLDLKIIYKDRILSATDLVPGVSPDQLNLFPQN